MCSIKDETMFSSNRKTTIAVELQRLDVESQARFDWLLDQNNEGRLTLAEREELQGLIAQYEHLPLQNTEALLQAARPDLVGTAGRINRVRLTQCGASPCSKATLWTPSARASSRARSIIEAERSTPSALPSPADRAASRVVRPVPQPMSRTRSSVRRLYVRRRTSSCSRSSAS